MRRARARHENALGENPDMLGAPSRAPRRRARKKRRHSDHFGMCARRPRRSVPRATPRHRAAPMARRSARGETSSQGARGADEKRAGFGAGGFAPPRRAGGLSVSRVRRPRRLGGLRLARVREVRAPAPRGARVHHGAEERGDMTRSRVWATRDGQARRRRQTLNRHGLSPPRRIVRFVFRRCEKPLDVPTFPPPPVPSWFAPTPRTRGASPRGHPRCAALCRVRRAGA